MLEYAIVAERNKPADAYATCKYSSLRLDIDPAGRADAFNPAELLLASLAACLLKGIERVVPTLRFTLRRATVRVHGVPQDSPPRIRRIDYELVLDTDEPDHRLEQLHRSVRALGAISNTLGAAVELTGTIRRVSAAVHQLPLGSSSITAPSLSTRTWG